MPGVDYDDVAARPNRRSEWLAVGAVALVVFIVLTKGVVAVLVLALLAVVVGLLVGIAVAAARAVRDRGAEDELI